MRPRRAVLARVSPRAALARVGVARRRLDRVAPRQVLERTPRACRGRGGHVRHEEAAIRVIDAGLVGVGGPRQRPGERARRVRVRAHAVARRGGRREQRQRGPLRRAARAVRLVVGRGRARRARGVGAAARAWTRQPRAPIARLARTHPLARRWRSVEAAPGLARLLPWQVGEDEVPQRADLGRAAPRRRRPRHAPLAVSCVIGTKRAKQGGVVKTVFPWNHEPGAVCPVR